MKQFKIEDLKLKGGIETVKLHSPDSIFISCASYEPRSLTVAECLSEDYRAKFGLIYTNQEFFENEPGNNAKKNLARLKEILIKHCDKVYEISGSWLDAKKQFESLRDIIQKINTKNFNYSDITLDSTTFTRESLLVTIALLQENMIGVNIRVLYTSPKGHGEWLSRGFRSVRNVMAFGGIPQPSYPTLLVLLSGFELDRAMKIIDIHEPQKVMLGIGDPPTQDKFLERNENEQKIILARQEVEKFKFSANSILACFNDLEKALKSYFDKYNIVLAPMSTKLSTIAVYLLAQKYPKIQITYGLPGEYNIQAYSSEPKDIYIDNIPIKETSKCDVK